MAKFEFEYTEIDGLLYLNIEIDGKGELDKLGKYGRIRPNYLYEQKLQTHRDCFSQASWQNIALSLTRLLLRGQSRFELII